MPLATDPGALAAEAAQISTAVHQQEMVASGLAAVRAIAQGGDVQMEEAQRMAAQFQRAGATGGIASAAETHAADIHDAALDPLRQLAVSSSLV